MFSNTDCPGPWLHARMNELANAVNKNLESGNFSYSGVASGLATQAGTLLVSDPATAYAAGLNASILLKQEDLYPYIITIDEYSPKLDYNKLKDFDVVGICISIGSYFDNLRKVKKSFRNPKLDNQYTLAKENNLSIALFTNLRALTLQEAEKELYEISLAVRKYPPSIGFWVKPTFGKSKTRNDKILELYQKSLEDLGLKDQIGLYCSKEELEKISWDKFKDSWYWWMDKHLKNVDKIHNLPTPQFFMFDNTSDELIEPDFTKAATLSTTASSNAYNVGATGGYTEAQLKVAQIAETTEKASFVSGMCAAFVSDVFKEAGYERPGGNGIDFWNRWKSTGGKDKNPPVGSVVVGSGYGHDGDLYGHVGISITGGRIVEILIA